MFRTLWHWTRPGAASYAWRPAPRRHAGAPRRPRRGHREERRMGGMDLGEVPELPRFSVGFRGSVAQVTPKLGGLGLDPQSV